MLLIVTFDSPPRSFADPDVLVIAENLPGGQVGVTVLGVSELTSIRLLHSECRIWTRTANRVGVECGHWAENAKAFFRDASRRGRGGAGGLRVVMVADDARLDNPDCTSVIWPGHGFHAGHRPSPSWSIVRGSEGHL